MENKIITFLVAKRTNDKDDFFKTFDGATIFKHEANVVILEDTNALKLIINNMSKNAKFRLLIHPKLGRDGIENEAYRLETIVNDVKAIPGCQNIEPYFITRSHEVENKCLNEKKFFVEESGVLCCHTSNLSGNLKISSKSFIDEMNVFIKGDIVLAEQKLVKSKPRIFIGSSVEGLDIARAIKAKFNHDPFLVDVWDEGVFKEMKTNIENLEQILNTYEYGIFVFRSDDKIYTRGAKKKVPRDNVILEYGMFLGKFSRSKTFFFIPDNKKVKIASDLLGVMPFEYKEDDTKRNATSAVGSSCDKIREIIKSN